MGTSDSEGVEDIILCSHLLLLVQLESAVKCEAANSMVPSLHNCVAALHLCRGQRIALLLLLCPELLLLLLLSSTIYSVVKLLLPKLSLMLLLLSPSLCSLFFSSSFLLLKAM